MRPILLPALLLIALGANGGAPAHAAESAATSAAPAPAKTEADSAAVPGAATAEPPTPEVTVNAVVRAWRDNDAGALFEQVPGVPPRPGGHPNSPICGHLKIPQ